LGLKSHSQPAAFLNEFAPPGGRLRNPHFKRCKTIERPTYYNLHPIVINLKARKGGPSTRKKGRTHPSSSLGLYEPLN